MNTNCRISWRLFTALIAMLLSTATLRAIDLSGTWKTSQFRDGLELTLTGATTLIVDVPKSLKNIYGDFPLTIQGSKKLTISSGAHGISVSSVNISTDVEITSKKDGLNIDRDIVIDGGNVNIDAKKDGIYSRHGSITIKNSHTTSACGTNCTAIVSKEGNITFGDNSTTFGETVHEDCKDMYRCCKWELDNGV